MFLGAISFINHPDPIPTTPVPTIFKRRLHPTEQNNAYINSLPLSLDLLAIANSTMPASHCCSTLRGINHPLLTRISPTNYLLRDIDYPDTTVHIGQITDYVQFDERLCAYGDSADFHLIPIGYMDFLYCLEQWCCQQQPPPLQYHLPSRRPSAQLCDPLYSPR